VDTGYQVGGLIGHTGNDVDISSCYAIGDVNNNEGSPAYDAGGLIGFSYVTNIQIVIIHRGASQMLLIRVALSGTR